LLLLLVVLLHVLHLLLFCRQRAGHACLVEVLVRVLKGVERLCRRRRRVAAVVKAHCL